jgi:hypothetical protein
MSQVPTILSTKSVAHSGHASSWDLRGSEPPRAHQLPSMVRIHEHQVSWLLLR